MPERPPRRLRRQWRQGLTSLWRFVTTPSDIANSFEAMLALAGPTVQVEFDRFAATPLGRDMLDEQPRRDLTKLLTDLDYLAALPDDSFGRAYLAYMGGDQMGTAAYFIAAAGLDEKGRRFGWSDDHVWFMNRMTHTHDLWHVVTGYDRDITGEVGVISFTAGHIPLVPLLLLLPYFMTLKPSQPVRWTAFVVEAFRYGRRAPSLVSVDYEALLPKPLPEVRRHLGLTDLREVHPRGIPENGWLLDNFERRVILA